MGRRIEITCTTCGNEFVYETGFQKGRVPSRCEECREKDPRNHLAPKSGQRIAITLTEHDLTQLDFLIKQTRQKPPEVMRQALRIYASVIALQTKL